MRELLNLYDNLGWETANEYFDGTQRKVLRDENGAKTVLLKIPAGFEMSPHSHLTVEQHFVIEGEYESNGKVYKAGSFQIFDAGDEHGPFVSKNGALILIVWDPIK